MMNAVELVVRRRLVRAFVQADAVSVQFIRRTARAKSEAGGWVASVSAPLLPQTVRIIPSKRRYDHGLVNSEAGEIPHTEYLLLGLHNLDVAVDDTFTWQGDTYKVVGISLLEREERTLCAITFQGPANG